MGQYKSEGAIYWTHRQLLQIGHANVAEAYKINLGRFAPTVFGWMIGAKKKQRMDDDGSV